MSFRDKFLGVSKNQTDWTNNNEIVLSESVNDERLTALRREVKSAFDQGIERLAQGIVENPPINVIGKRQLRGLHRGRHPDLQVHAARRMARALPGHRPEYAG